MMNFQTAQNWYNRMIKFNSKIMLFGEYTVLSGSDALLIPFSKFSGEFDFIVNGQQVDDKKLQSHKILVKFYTYLHSVLPETNLYKKFKLNHLKQDLDKGLYFKSNIPIGYGIGSSGALVAALFSRYSEKVIENLNRENILNLQKHTAILESFFHGKSSGLDPLLSYLDVGMLVKEDRIILENVDYSCIHPFLIDTNISRSTIEMVKLYQEKCKKSEYQHWISSELLPMNNKCIECLINGDQLKFFSSLRELSSFQLKNFKEMILPEFESVWKLGLESDDFYLKLCGAGGGGYILGFAKNPKILIQLKKELNINIIEI